MIIWKGTTYILHNPIFLLLPCNPITYIFTIIPINPIMITRGSFLEATTSRCFTQVVGAPSRSAFVWPESRWAEEGPRPVEWRGLPFWYTSLGRGPGQGMEMGWELGWINGMVMGMVICKKEWIISFPLFYV